MKNNLNRLRLVGLCILICSIGSAISFTTKANPKVVIVGAGPSGISAGVKLIESGFEDVTILEAESRIGGRIHTIPFGENVIDMGAQWCHGEKGNVIYELAYKEGLLEHAPEGEYSFVRSNAQLLTRDVVGRLVNITEKLKEERDKELSEYKGGSYGRYMREKFHELLTLPENADLDKEIANDFYTTFEKEQSSDEGTDTLDVISAHDYTIFQEVDGDYELNWKDKGYKEFLRLLMKANETGKEYGVLDGRIKLNKKVNYINWKRNDRMVLLKCEDGHEILADHVIVTVSLGVLKENYLKMFEPSLPKEKENAIESLSYGSFNKVFLEFSERFWVDHWDGIYLLWRDEDLKEIRGTNRSWLEGLYSFNTLPYQRNILEGWIIGDGARHMENLSIDEIKDGCFYVLDKFLPPDITEPINVIISTWYSNPNFRGCYSYHSLETEKFSDTNQHLANAVKFCDTNHLTDNCERIVLQFAGEATHPKYYATVHGAVESGFREAQRLKDYYSHKSFNSKEE